MEKRSASGRIPMPVPTALPNRVPIVWKCGEIISASNGAGSSAIQSMCDDWSQPPDGDNPGTARQGKCKDAEPRRKEFKNLCVSVTPWQKPCQHFPINA